MGPLRASGGLLAFVGLLLMGAFVASIAYDVFSTYLSAAEVSSEEEVASLRDHLRSRAALGIAALPVFAVGLGLLRWSAVRRRRRAG